MPEITDALGAIGLVTQLGGSVISAFGAESSANAQKEALGAQANLDLINAKSNALAYGATADLKLINDQAGFESQNFNAQQEVTSAKGNAQIATQGAALNLQTTTNSATLASYQSENRAALGELQATTQATGLKAGAEMDQLSAQMYELQAQSALLHGEWREQDSRMQYAQTKSHATVQMARGNIDMGEGVGLMTRVGIDVMSERAAEQIQQETLMAAMASRTQESQALVSSATKTMQASSILSMAKYTATVDNNMTDFSGAIAINDATMKAGLTAISNQYNMTLANANAEWTKAMTAAGLNNAEATNKLSHTMADTGLANAEAAADVKRAGVDGINPGLAFDTTLLNGLGHVASSWYQYSKQTTGTTKGP